MVAETPRCSLTTARCWTTSCVSSMPATAGCAAVISANGALTLQVARALKRVGLIWGSDIGLLGFDELEWAELAGVGITTLKQPTWQIGYAAVEQVIRRIAGTNDPIRERVFSGELIVRGSTSR
nr:substrate-binding domain-containing protein [Klebsiella pneumoniae subsp. pneumoniae]